MEKEKFNREEYSKNLADKKALLPCHRCGQHSFALLNGYSYLPIQDTLTSGTLSGPKVPAILVICNNCGAITPHAVGAFDSLTDKKKKEVKNG